MLDKKIAEEYKKIKPDDGLKSRIMYNVATVAETSRKVPFYVRIKPVLSGALVCMLIFCCLTVANFDFLGSGDVSVAYAQTGEVMAVSSVGRSAGIAVYSTQYNYDRLPNGTAGAEFTFEFGGKTELKTECGSLYLKNEDGTYKELGQKAKIDGTVTVFWTLPEEMADEECVVTIKNRSSKLKLVIECFDCGYRADLVSAE